MAYGLWQGAERATGNIAKTGMKLMEFQAQRQDYANRLKLEEEKMGMLRSRETRDAAVGNLALEKAEKEAEERNRRIDITTHPMFLSLPEETRPKILNFFATNRFTDETGKGTQGDIMEGVKTIETTTPLFKQYMEPVVNAKKGAVLTAWNELSAAKTAGDPKKIQAAEARFNALNIDYQVSSDKFDKHLEFLMEKDAEEPKLMRGAGGVMVPEAAGAEFYEKDETEPLWQRKKKTYFKDGKQMTQEYDYNPKTRESIDVGKPYESRDIGGALMDWLKGSKETDPKGIF